MQVKNEILRGIYIQSRSARLSILLPLSHHADLENICTGIHYGPSAKAGEAHVELPVYGAPSPLQKPSVMFVDPFVRDNFTSRLSLAGHVSLKPVNLGHTGVKRS